MSKYYTPRSAIRFANLAQAAFKRLAMTAEVVIACVSDHSHKSEFYSGVIRYRIDDWKRYSVIWLYGDSTETTDQDFVQPSITDVSCSTYYENRRVTSPSSPDVCSLTGSNFVSGSVVLVDDVEASDIIFVDRHTMTFQPPVWPYEQSLLPLTVIRPDLRHDTTTQIFSYEYRPTGSSFSPPTVYNSGLNIVSVVGTRFKKFSEVIFSSGTWEESSNNVTYVSPMLLTTYAPQFPATGTYSIQVRSPSGLLSNQLAGLNVIYHAPVINDILPYNTGSIAGGTDLVISGNFFLTGAYVTFDGTSSLPVDPSRSFYSDGRIDPTKIYVSAPPHAKGEVNVLVTNPEDGQTSNVYPYRYIIPIPTIEDVNFSGALTAQARKTGSQGSVLYVTGTAFTGSDDGMRITLITLTSGVFSTASDQLIIDSQTLLHYTIPALTTGSKYDVTVSSSAGTATLLNAFEYADTPTIDSIAPSSGVTSGGTILLITGRPFYSGGSRVFLNSTAADPTVVYSINQLTAVTPATGADGGYANVTVQNYGVLEGTTPSAFEYVPYPTATLVRSSAGNNRVPAYTVSSVTVVGSRFMRNIVNAGTETAQGTRIFIGSNLTADVTSFVDSTQVVLSLPSHAPGFVDIRPINRGLANGQILFNAIEFVSVPTITSISPSSVVYTGGTTVTVNGTNFMNSTDTVVVVDGVTVAATVTNSTTLTFSAPAHAAGTVSVYVKNRDTTTSNTTSLLYVNNPTITSLSPNFGSNAGGYSVLVNGTVFSPTLTAVLSGPSLPGGSVTLAPSNITANQFTFVAPATTPLARGNVNLTIQSYGLNAALIPAFTYEQTPLISSVSPGSVLYTGGTTITVTGDGFINGVTTVWVDGVQIAPVTVNSRYNLTFAAPAHAVGVVTLQVKNTSLTANSSLTYLAAPAPYITQVLVDGVDAAGNAKLWDADTHVITVNGSDFTTGGSPTISLVTRGGTITPSYTSNTQVQFTMPANDGFLTSGYFAVTNAAGVSNYWLYTFVTAPTITSFSPDGYGASGGVVDIYGTSFTPTTYLKFSNGLTTYNLGTITWLGSSTHARITVPAITPLGSGQGYLTTNIYNQTTITDEAASSYNNKYKLYSPPLCTALSPASALTAGGGTCTVYHNALFTTDATVYWGGSAIASSVGVGYNTVTIPAHAAGSISVAYGYQNSLGTVFTGGSQTFTYSSVSPISITLTGLTSSYSRSVIDGYIGTSTVSTTPRLYITVAGGVPPYTTVIESVSDPDNFGTPLSIEYAVIAPYTNSARWYDVVIGVDAAQKSYRWKVTDSVGTVAYSSQNILLAYEIYEASLGPTCVVPDTLIMLAGNLVKRAGDLEVGDLVRTRPDNLLIDEMDDFVVTHVSKHLSSTMTLTFTDGRTLRCTPDHRLATADGWVEAGKLSLGQKVWGVVPGVVASSTPNGTEQVVKISIDKAKTFMSNGLLSHNLKKWEPI